MSILDKISDFANRAADKLIPKELAPFLPIAGAFLPGLGLVGTDVFSRFVLPQLLTAASSAKLQGEIDPTQQAITGILSALQTPAQQTRAEQALLEQNPDLLQRAEKANLLEDATRLTEDEFRSLVTSPGGGPKIEGYSSIDQFIDRFVQPITGGDPVRFGADAENILKFGTGDDARFFLEGSKDLSDFLKTTTQTPIVGLDKLTGQELIDELAKAEGFTAGDITSKLEDLQKLPDIGSQQGLQALNRARQFFDSPVGFNTPTFTKLGIGAGPFLAAQAANLEAEQEALEAEEAAEAERFASARDDLFDYFRRLSDPRGIFAAMGGRVGFKEGGRGEVGQRLAERGIKAEPMMNRLKTQAIDKFRNINKVPTNELLEIAGNAPLQQFIGNFVNRGMNRMMEQAKDFSKKVDLPLTRRDYFQTVGISPFTQRSMVRRFAQDGGIMSTAPGMPQGMQVDGRNGTFIPMGVKEKADDVPAMLSKNEFVMTADAVRAMGDGNVNKGAQRMYDLMNTLEPSA